MMKVAGLDISLNNLGICKVIIKDRKLTVDELLLVKPDKSDAETKKKVRKNSDDLRRARWLREGMIEAIADCHIVCVEMPVGSQSARAMASYGICTGVIAGIDKPLIEVTPYDVKLAATGIKTASKEEMIEWAVAKHPEGKWKYKTVKGVKSLTNDNEHMADALAAIYAGLKTAELKAVMQIMFGLKASI